MDAVTSIDEPMPRAVPKPLSNKLIVHGEGDRRSLNGALDVLSLDAARTALGGWLKSGKSRQLDLSQLSGLDTPGALFLAELQDLKVKLTGASKAHKELLDLVHGLERKPLPKAPAVPRWREVVTQIGRGTDQAWRDSLDVITFVGRTLTSLAHVAIHPSQLRTASISRQVRETGINALPIVGLLAIMISVVLAFQGVAQLRPFGGEDWTINLVSVSVLREMAVLVTAIMVAGRSGSAFTAEIGVMKSREEIDALQVMGLGPMEMLVIPRVIGLIITLPLLTFFADMMGLFGGSIVSHYLLDVAPMQYLDRVRLAVDRWDLFVGLVKAPIFAFVIATVSCMHGLKVRGSAESVGRETTRAVVKSIFLVIVLDALFSVLFETIDI
ncbi:MlaE family lipid ABC transporter permease subunit [soil metagenome]